MKAKIRIKDFWGKETVQEKEIPAKDHLEAQKKYKSKIFLDRSKQIPRKAKYKKVYTEE